MSTRTCQKCNRMMRPLSEIVQELRELDTFLHGVPWEPLGGEQRLFKAGALRDLAAEISCSTCGSSPGDSE